jgi:hypothetical protein
VDPGRDPPRESSVPRLVSGDSFHDRA